MNLKSTSKGIMSVSIRVVVYLIVIIVTYKLATVGYEFGNKVMADTGYQRAPGKNVSIQISKSDSRLDVAKTLENKGIIEDKWVFYVQSYLYEADIKPGKYKVNSSATSEEILQKISGIKVKKEE